MAKNVVPSFVVIQPPSMPLDVLFDILVLRFYRYYPFLTRDLVENTCGYRKRILIYAVKRR